MVDCRIVWFQGKNVDEFDHVKHDRMLDAEDLDGQGPAEESNVKKEGMSEDMQRMMQKLNSAEATKVLKHYLNILPIFLNQVTVAIEVVPATQSHSAFAR